MLSFRLHLQRLGPLLLFLAIGFVLFPSAGRDDSYITFWPAETLATSGVVRNYDGEAVEQSSSLALVALIAASMRATGWSAPLSGWILGIAAGLGAVALTRRLGERVRPGLGNRASWVTAATPCFTYWSFSGAEPAWVALGALAFVGTTARAIDRGRPIDWLAATGATILVATVRPEGPLAAGYTLAGLLFLRWIARQRGTARARLGPIAAALALVAGIALVLILARLAWFDAALPQPVSAKSGGLRPQAVLEGLRYLTRRGELVPLLVLAVLGIVRGLADAVLEPDDASLRPLMALFAFSHLSFVVLVGGDWMEGSRFVGHALPILALVALDGVLRGWPRASTLATAGLVLIGLGGAIAFSRDRSRALPLWTALDVDTSTAPTFEWLEHANWAHARDIPLARALATVVCTLQARGVADVRVAAENTGFVVYHTVRRCPDVEIVDVHGLTDRTITHGVLADRTHRAQFGVMWTPERFYRAWVASAERRAPPPIAFFNAARPDSAQWVAEHGLVPLYAHRCPEDLGGRWSAGRAPTSTQVIAVHRSLVDDELRALELPGNDLATWSSWD